MASVLPQLALDDVERLRRSEIDCVTAKGPLAVALGVDDLVESLPCRATGGHTYVTSARMSAATPASDPKTVHLCMREESSVTCTSLPVTEHAVELMSNCESRGPPR